jgi:hypothetical protein
MTLTGEGAVVGQTVEVSAAAPVRDLSAIRFQEEVRLRWIWPDSATAALVAWWPLQADHGKPTGSRLCSRREFFAEGGFSARIGHTAVVVEVSAVYGDPRGQARGPSVQITVPPLGVPVRYRIRRAWKFPPPLGPRRYDVELTAAYPCELPDLVVVESRNQTQPSAPDQGTLVARVERQALAADEPVCVKVRLDQPGPSWLQCFVDPDRRSQDEASIVLHPPPVRQQRVR